MEKTESFRLISRPLRRGVILFRLLWLASIGLGGLALATPGYRFFAIAGFLLGVLFVLGMLYMRGKYLSAWRACENPQMVYWAHPTTRGGHVLEQPTDDCRRLVLHLRDGTQFEFGLPAPEMSKFIAWLNARNPSVRWGAYDKVEANRTQGA